MKTLKKKIRATIPALVYAFGFMVVLILSAFMSDMIHENPIVAMIMTTAIVVFYVLAIYFLFRTAADIHQETAKAAVFSWFWFVTANILIVFIAGSAFVGALNKSYMESVEIAMMYNILIGWIVATHILRTVNTRLFDLMIGMMAWVVIFSLFFSMSTGFLPNLDINHIYILGAAIVFTITYFVVNYLKGHWLHKEHVHKDKKK